MSYPPPSTSDNGILPSCPLALWIAEHGFNDAAIGGSNRPWTFEEIYTTPLSNPGDTDHSILHRILDALPNAEAAGHVSTRMRENLERKIDLFLRGGISGPVDARGITFNSMLCDGTRDDSAEVDGTKLVGFLAAMRIGGLYFPNNHTEVGKHGAIDILIQGTAVTPGLWDYEGTVDGGPNRRFGSFTMRELFQTPLKSLSTQLFWAVRFAKRYAIIWAHGTQTTIGNPIDSLHSSGSSDLGELTKFYYGGSNKKCCRLGVCIDTNVYSYCGPTSQTDSSCNSLSDPCT